MSHHNKIPGGSEKPKILQYPGNIPNNSLATKRGCAIDNGSSATKKIKLDVGNNQPMWNAEHTVNKASLCDSNIDEVIKLSSKNDTSIKSFTISKDGEAPTDKGKLTICNLGRTISEIAPTSPLNSDDYVLFTSDISDFIDDNDCVKSNPSKPLIVSQPTSQESMVSPINLNSTVRREATNKNNSLQSDSLEIVNMPSPESSTSNEIELVLLPSAQENKSVSLQTATESPIASGGGTRIVGQSNNLMRQGNVTYTRITTPGTIASGLQSSATVLNRMNVSATLKSQQLMVTTKKLTSEVTQTTAKVSIGNTTISVPLLKSLNSSQIIHAGNLTADLQKHVQPPTVQTNSPQAQINFSKILNVKRGQKGSQPKIVSLSQLQIKPVSSAKLVQAKVLSQKLSQVQCTVTTNSQANATSLVAITTSKAKQNIALSQQSAKKLSVSLNKQEVLLHGSTDDDVNNTDINATAEASDATKEKSSVNTSAETIQKVLVDKNETTQLNMCTIERPLKVISPVTDTDNVTGKTTIKKVLNPNVNILPLLTPLSKNSDQQGATGIYPAVSIIRQNAPQLITTSATGTCVSVSTNASDTNAQTEFHGTKSPININALCGKINATPIISIPRNISLMLAKNNINQQGKATIVATKNVNTIDQKVKKINLSVSSALNVAPVSVSQAYSVTSQSLETSNKQAVISVTVQPSSYSSPSDQTLFSRKTVKVTPYTLSTVDHHRLKSVEVHEQDFRQNLAQNSQNVDILPAKRSRTDNQQIHTESSGENNADATICDKTANTFADKTNTDSRVLSPSCAPQTSINSSTNSKTEESNNVLLKQLLQNSSASHNSQATMSPNTTATVTASSICNQVLSRKVINLRAPSLGLVSSLEQQLARPVIPPVPATTSTQVQTDLKTKLVRADHQEDLGKNTNTEIIGVHNESKSKPVVQVISKETSFVSNPNIPSTLEDTHYSQTLSIKNRDLELKTIKNCNTNICNITMDSGKMHSTSVHDVSLPHVNMTHKDNNDFRKAISSTNEEGVQNSSSGSLTKGASSVNNDNAKVQISSSEPLNIMPVPKEKQESHVENTSSLSTYSMSSSSVLHENIENNDKFKSTNKSPKLVKSSNSITESTTKMKLTKQENNMQNIKNIVHVNVNDKCMSVDTMSSTVQTMIQQSTVDKDAETRKKKKREYQKHRRQLLNNKDCPVTATNSTINLAGTKKRARKISKVEEDYDNFIDNLMTHLRQMKPLQVLEPLLNRNFVVCSTYGMSNSARVVNSKENGEQMIGPPLLGEYGNAQRSNVMTLYDSQSCELLEKTGEKHFSTIQNDFYDQEFSSNIRNSDYEKLFRIWGIVRERNIECSDVIASNNNLDDRIFPSANHVNWISVKQLVYPGLVIMNNKSCQYLGRMSPSLPLIEPTLNQKKCVIIRDNDKANGLEYTKHNMNAECNLRSKSDDSNSRMVTLSLPLSAVNNVFGVLKDLANLLHIPPPTIYKVIDTPTYNLTRELPCRNSQGKSCINLQQDVLCGRKKVCYSCGMPTDTAGIRAYKTPFCDTKQSLHSSNLSPMQLHFCSKLCYDHFKGLSKSQMPNNVANFETQIKTEVEYSDDKFDTTKATGKFEDNQYSKVNEKEAKNCRYKHFSSNCFRENQQINKHIAEKDFKEMPSKGNTSNNPDQNKLPDSIIKSSVEDTRQCVFCYQRGDGVANGPARLLNFDIDKWVHLNCALWSSEVYETISGGLMNFPAALQMGLNQSCCSCQQLGATVRCFKNRCGMIFHLPCAIREQCVFYKNKTIHCHQHATRLEKENELTTLTVQRRVFVERDENRQVATVMHHSELTNLLRVGTLIFLNIGQLLPHQLEAFHNMDYIYPVGYKVIRFYWSMKKPNKRCRYICSIAEIAGRPEFRIQVQEQGNEIELRDSTPNSVWQKILTTITAIRKENKLVKLFPQFVSGEDLFGLSEPSVIRIIESLPGIETLTDYRFKYGRNPLLELPLAINPSGAARTEPKQRQVLSWRKPHTQRTGSTPNQRMANSTTSTIAGEIACPYSKQFVHSKSSQYKKMKQEWRNNVYLARSKIQGLGLYAARDIEKHTMIIEYIGEVIRTEVSEIREKQYEAKNRGIYMFRLDEDRVVDATLSGGLARYINHACNPNCVTETVDVDRELRIIIFAKRRINRGEELSYDYKFDIEDDAHKISCMCGAPNCRKWMN